MDETVDRIIRRALDDARAIGLDSVAQNVEAIEAVRRVRPDLSPLDAIVLLKLIRES